MDYQTFNSHNPSFGGQFSTQQGQPAPPPAHFFTDPQAQAQARLQQQQQQHQQNNQQNFQYAAGQQFPNGQPQHQPTSSFSGPAMMGGAMAGGGVMQPGQMPAAASSMNQARASLQHQHQQLPTSSPSPYPAPYSQALPSPAHQQFAQNRQTASPASTTGQPYATPQSAPHQSPSTLASNGQQQPMNIQAAVKPDAQAQTPGKAVPQSPVSPVTQARSQDRMSTLLEINSILIKEVCDLQTQGKAGQAPTGANGKPEGEKPPPSKEYVDYMRRLQANLAFLAQMAEKNHKPGQQLQPGPAIMVPPAAPVELTKLYQKLQELFPGWKGQTPQVKQSPGPAQRMNSTGSQPPQSAGA